MLFAEMELGGWVCLGVFLFAVYSVITAVKSGVEAVGAAAGAVIEHNPEIVTRGVVEGVLWNFFGND
jgi:hypothetical protein